MEKSLLEQHKENRTWKAEIDFYDKEFNFYLRVIEKEVVETPNTSLRATLDAFADSFKRLKHKLHLLETNIDFQEQKFKVIEEKSLADPDEISVKDHLHIRKHIIEIEDKAKVLKETFYEQLFNFKKDWN